MKATHRRILTLLLPGLFAFAAGASRSEPIDPNGGPAHVEIRNSQGRYELLLNKKPFYIKGAGVEHGSQEKLQAHGGNSFRTWSGDNGQEILDRAKANGLYVAMGLDVDHERRGFDYDNADAVAKQFAKLTAQVEKLKNHPALLVWVIGNELNFEKNPKVWDAVNSISRKIHEIDPNHPTTTTLAGFKKEMANLVKSRAPDLDFICFQMYADIVNLPRYLRESAWDKPYIVTEWGATGHWECGKTDWDAPIENDSTTKANFYRMRYEKAIQPDNKLCLGSYVFFWGQKQERTPTWYGMFLKSGEDTAAVDTMQYIWTGAGPANRSPVLEGVWLNEKKANQSVHMKLGQSYSAKVKASDPDGDALTYSWEVMEESTERKIGGDRESVPRRLSGLINAPEKSEVSVKAPEKPGAYRLFVYVFDGKGHAAHANIPFYVDSSTETLRATGVQTTSSP
jgi:hypothetical protein